LLASIQLQTYSDNYISYPLQRPYSGADLENAARKPPVFLKITPKAIFDKLFCAFLLQPKRDGRGEIQPITE
jgi:hypothetical protein